MNITQTIAVLDTMIRYFIASSGHDLTGKTPVIIFNSEVISVFY